MKITYIHHSSFLVETCSASLLFDYFEGTLPAINKDKPLIILASHRHGDHFSPTIFSLAENHPNCSFVLSCDIWKKRAPEEFLQATHFIKPDSSINVGPCMIRTLKSTDEGVAFLVSVDTKTIYHSGDLNDWYWQEEPKQWNDNMHAAYMKQIQKLSGLHLDVAFIPADPRQGDAYSLGTKELLTITVPDYIFPMHFWNDYGMCKKLQTELHKTGYACHILEILHQGQSFTIEE